MDDNTITDSGMITDVCRLHNVVLNRTVGRAVTRLALEPEVKGSNRAGQGSNRTRFKDSNRTQCCQWLVIYQRNISSTMKHLI